MHTLITTFVVFFIQTVYGTSLDFESPVLGQADIDAFPAVKFGNLNEQIHGISECRAFPGSPNWPPEDDWQLLNKTLDGVLLKPELPAVSCYPGLLFDAAKCQYLVTTAPTTSFYVDDPVVVLTQWPQGDTCLPFLNATGKCTRGGFPEYVVNATTVKHVQAAVNFARNKNLRLVVKYVV
jgi:hypothetical protein